MRLGIDMSVKKKYFISGCAFLNGGSFSFSGETYAKSEAQARNNLPSRIKASHERLRGCSLPLVASMTVVDEAYPIKPDISEQSYTSKDLYRWMYQDSPYLLS